MITTGIVLTAITAGIGTPGTMIPGTIAAGTVPAITTTVIMDTTATMVTMDGIILTTITGMAALTVCITTPGQARLPTGTETSPPGEAPPAVLTGA